MNVAKYIFWRNLVRRNKISPAAFLRGDCAIAIGSTVRHCVLMDATAGKIEIGENCWIDSFVRIVSSGAVRVGRNCTINRFTTISGNVSVGNDCLIAPNVFISSGSHEFRRRSRTIKEQDRSDKASDCPIAIGNDVWIGINSVVMPGVQVGSGAVIGAGSIVTGPVEEYWIVAGAPARKIDERR